MQSDTQQTHFFGKLKVSPLNFGGFDAQLFGKGVKVQESYQHFIRAGLVGGVNPPWPKSHPPLFVWTFIIFQSYRLCEPHANLTNPPLHFLMSLLCKLYNIWHRSLANRLNTPPFYVLAITPLGPNKNQTYSIKTRWCKLSNKRSLTFYVAITIFCATHVLRTDRWTDGLYQQI
jgi:hypothetical protein